MNPGYVPGVPMVGNSPPISMETRRMQVQLKTDKFAYVQGESIHLSLEGFDGAIAEVTNFNVALLRVTPIRDEFAMSWGHPPKIANDCINLAVRLSENIQPGIYYLTGVKLIDSNEKLITELPVASKAFQVYEVGMSLMDEETILGEMQAVLSKRAKELATPIRSERAIEGTIKKRFRGWVFGSGCVIKTVQATRGYSLLPLPSSHSHRSLHEAVSGFFELQFGAEPLPFSENFEREFASSRPMFVIQYVNIEALDMDDAFATCWDHSSSVNALLGIERSMKPSSFACFIQDIESGQFSGTYSTPRFYGNLISGFGGADTARFLEDHLETFQRDAFVRLAVSTFSDATAEDDHSFRLLRFWAVLELVADRFVRKGKEISHHGSKVRKSNGNAVTTDSKVGRVFSYLAQEGTRGSTGTVIVEDGVQKKYSLNKETHEEDINLTLWDMVSACYAIRCSVAHTGQFNPDQIKSEDQKLAAKLATYGGGLCPFKFVENQAEIVLRKLLNESGKKLIN